MVQLEAARDPVLPAPDEGRNRGMTQPNAMTTHDMRDARAAGWKAHGYQIHLSFLAVDGEIPSLAVRRRLPAIPQEPRPDAKVMAYRLRAEHGDEDD